MRTRLSFPTYEVTKPKVSEARREWSIVRLFNQVQLRLSRVCSTATVPRTGMVLELQKGCYRGGTKL